MGDLAELFRSTEEEVTPLHAEIQGEVPSWLNGTLVRLGPGIFDIGDDFTLNHWFDGYGVLINFKIQNGKVIFSKRILQSDAYKKAISVGRPVFTEYGTKAYPDPTKSLFSKLKSALLPELTDSDAINIFQLEDSIYAATETNLIHRINPYTLETKEKIDLGKTIGVFWASSHYFRDEAGTSWTVGTSIGSSGPQYHIIKIPKAPDGKAETAWKCAKKIANIYPNWKTDVCYYHSFAMSQNYIIFVEQPMVVNSKKLLSTVFKPRSLRECMDWHPKDLNRFIIVEKATGKVCSAKIKTSQPYFSLHCINAYEKDGFFVFDTLAHETPNIVDKLYLEKLRNSEFDGSDPAVGRRYIFPKPELIDILPSNENVVTIQAKATAIKKEDTWYLTPEKITDAEGYELPTMNHTFYGKPYQYFYVSGMYDPGKFRNTLVKVDTETKEIKCWKADEYTYPGEALFVQTPGSAVEDDGILLSCVTDVRKDHQDFLLILDAKTMTEKGRAKINAHIPNLIHSLFLPSDIKFKE